MNKRYYISLVVLGACILSAGGGYFFMIRNVWKKAENVALYKSDVVFAEQKKQYADTMLSSFGHSQKSIETMQDFFVKKQGEVEFIEFIEKTAKDQGLTVETDNVSLDTPKGSTVKNMEHLTLRFHVVGSWSRVWNFSQTLELLPYAVDINSLAFVREDQGQVTNKAPVWKGVYVIKVLKKK